MESFVRGDDLNKSQVNCLQYISANEAKNQFNRFFKCVPHIDFIELRTLELGILIQIMEDYNDIDNIEGLAFVSMPNLEYLSLSKFFKTFFSEQEHCKSEKLYNEVFISEFDENSFSETFFINRTKSYFSYEQHIKAEHFTQKEDQKEVLNEWIIVFFIHENKGSFKFQQIKTFPFWLKLKEIAGFRLDPSVNLLDNVIVFPSHERIFQGKVIRKLPH